MRPKLFCCFSLRTLILILFIFLRFCSSWTFLIDFDFLNYYIKILFVLVPEVSGTTGECLKMCLRALVLKNMIASSSLETIQNTKQYKIVQNNGTKTSGVSNMGDIENMSSCRRPKTQRQQITHARGFCVNRKWCSTRTHAWKLRPRPFVYPSTRFTFTPSRSFYYRSSFSPSSPSFFSFPSPGSFFSCLSPGSLTTSSWNSICFTVLRSEHPHPLKKYSPSILSLLPSLTHRSCPKSSLTLSYLEPRGLKKTGCREGRKGRNAENGKLRAESRSLPSDYRLLGAQLLPGLGTVPCAKHYKHPFVCMTTRVNQYCVLTDEKS